MVHRMHGEQVETPDVVAPQRLDLRLAGFALGVWLVALLAMNLPAVGGFAVAVAAGAVVAALLVIRRDPGAGARNVVALVLLGAALGAAVTAARVAERDAAPIRALAADHTSVRAVLVVTDDPRPTGTGPTRAGPAVYAVPGRLRVLTSAALTVDAGARVLVLASHPAWRTILPGQAVTASGRVLPARGGDLRAAVISVNTAPEPIGRPGVVQRAAGRLRAGLQAACTPLPAEPGGLLPGLVVGDTSRLDPGIDADFQLAGMTHLNAVSGSNVAIVIGAVLLLARAARAGPRTAVVVSIVALAGFVVLARPSPSVLRAAAMGAIALVALASGRARAALPALCTAVVVLIVVDPELAASPGFALSVLATGGLLLLARPWRDALRARGVPPGLAEAVAVPAAAQVACAPVVAGLSGAVSLVAVPANLLAMPAVAPATVLGVLAAMVSPVWARGAEFLAWVGSWPARWLVLVARTAAEVPAGALPWLGGAAGGLLLAAVLAGVVVGLTGVVVGRRWLLVRRLLAVVVVAAVVAGIPVRIISAAWPPPGWIMVVCDVGQGDATVLRAGPATAVVVDAGPEPVAVDRCLRRLDVDEVPIIVLTHFHVDHVGGLAGVFRSRSVGMVVTTSFPEPRTGRDSVVAAANRAGEAGRVPVRAAPTGWTAQIGWLRLDAIGTAEALHGTRSDPNNNSLVLRVAVAGHTLLLAGDAEVEQQHALVRAFGPAGLRADVVKVSHHGSAFQDREFLDMVDAGAALVSVGAGNSYGHPNVPVLAYLARGGARVLRTDHDGDLAVSADGRRLTVLARGLRPGER
jgi:competence protein ComEC